MIIAQSKINIRIYHFIKRVIDIISSIFAIVIIIPLSIIIKIFFLIYKDKRACFFCSG